MSETDEQYTARERELDAAYARGRADERAAYADRETKVQRLVEATKELLLVCECDDDLPAEDSRCATDQCADLCGHPYCEQVGCVAAKIFQVRAALSDLEATK